MLRRRSSIFILFVALAIPAAAQVPTNDKSPEKPSRAEVAEETRKERKPRISAKEAEELFRSVDSIMKFASGASGYPIKSAVKRELVNQEQVRSYIKEKADEDEDRKRMERSEVVIKKFGLLPRDFDLMPFLISLMRDQVAGFYDTKRKTVHLLDWLPTESQKPVMAHELTHALQDQFIDLEKWIKQSRDLANKSADSDAKTLEVDEESSARNAVSEGQAMLVLIEYILEPVGKTVVGSPQIVEAMKAGMDSTESSPLLAAAPLLLRESMIFPYRDGLGFAAEVLRAGGRDKAFRGSLENPPANTHEILTPRDYLAGKKIPPLRLPNILPLVEKNYERYDVGTMGQFDIVLLAKQFANASLAESLSPKWRGGMYYAVKRKTKKDKKAPVTTADLALLYVSNWADEKSAKRFAEMYESSFKKRYSNAVFDSAKPVAWMTEEGPLSVQVEGTVVTITEGFEAELVAPLQNKVRETLASSTPAKAAEMNDLSLRITAPVHAIHRALYH